MSRKFTVPIELPGNPTQPLEAAPKQYVDAAPPPAHATTHQPGGADPLAVDAVAATGSLRTLGTGATQAAVGSHGHALTAAGITGVLTIAKGGTNGSAVPTLGGAIVGTGTAYTSTAAGTVRQILASNGAAAPTWQDAGLDYLPDAWPKKSVKVATTVNITLSAPQTIDNVGVLANDRVLVKNQTAAAENGIYQVNSGAWTRVTDADTASKIAGAVVNVDRGTLNGGQLWTTTFKSTDTLGTTAMPWSPITGGPEIYEEGSPVVTDALGLNFVGAGVTATNDGLGNATVTIPGGGVMWSAWNAVTRNATWSAGTIRWRRSVDGSLVQLDINGLVIASSAVAGANGNLSPDLTVCTLPANAYPDTGLHTTFEINMSSTYALFCAISNTGAVIAYATNLLSGTINNTHTGFASDVYAAPSTGNPSPTGAGLPIGAITMWGAASVPSDWLVCNGQTIPAQYTALIALYGATVPDMRSRVPIGVGTFQPTLKGDEAMAEIDRTPYGEHDHQIQGTNHVGNNTAAGGSNQARVSTIDGNVTGTHNHGGQTVFGSTAYDGAFPHLGVHFIIKAL